MELIEKVGMGEVSCSMVVFSDGEYRYIEETSGTVTHISWLGADYTEAKRKFRLFKKEWVRKNSEVKQNAAHNVPLPAM